MCLVYLDDVVVFGETFEQHQQRLAVVLDCFARSNLVLNPKKCCFGMTEVIFFCHCVISGGVRPDSAKLEAIIL